MATIKNATQHNVTKVVNEKEVKLNESIIISGDRNAGKCTFVPLAGPFADELTNECLGQKKGAYFFLGKIGNELQAAAWSNHSAQNLQLECAMMADLYINRGYAKTIDNLKKQYKLTAATSENDV